MPKIDPRDLDNDESIDGLPSTERIKHRPKVEKDAPKSKKTSKRNKLARDLKEFHEGDA